MSKKRHTERPGKTTKQGKQSRLESWFASPWFSAAAVCIVGAIVYSNTLQSTFHLDDEISIVNNPSIRKLTDLSAIWHNTPTRLLTYLSFALNYQLGGLNVFGYHAVNITIHLAAALAVWLLIRQLFQTPAMQDQRIAKQSSLIALSVALVFVAHPIQTQAVTYISQRAASLASLFYLLSVYFYGSARLFQAKGEEQKKSLLLFGVSGLFGLLALFSKEIALSLPFALLIYELYFFRGSGKINWKFISAILLFFIVVPLVLMTLNLFSLSDALSIAGDKYFYTQPRVIVTYLRLIIFPTGQNLDYDFRPSNSIFEIATLGSLLLLLALLALAFKLFRHHHILSFGIIWFFLTLALESSFIPLLDVIFEHRVYLPMVGASLFLVVLLFQLLGERSFRSFIIITLAAVGVLGSLTYERNSVWRDEITLWSDVIQKSPLKPRAYNNRGRALAEMGRKQEALADFSRALILDPAFSDAYNNRSNVYVQMGRADEAIADCDSAILHASHFRYQRAMIYFNRGTALIQKGQLERALLALNDAIADNPDHESAHFNRAIAYARSRQFQKAIEDYNEVIRINPRHAKAFNNRGAMYRELGKLNEALSDFQRSAELQPDYGPAFINKGIVLGMKGVLSEAISSLTLGLKFEPGSAEGFYNRGLIHYRSRDFEKALADFSQAIRINAGYAQAYLERARTLTALRRFKDADEDLKKAKQLGATPNQALINAASGRK